MQFLKSILLLFSLFFLLSFSGAVERKESVAATDTLHTNYLSPAKVPMGDSIINFGKLFLNTPYRYGSPGTSSFDCSGFTSYVYRNFGYNLKRSSAEQAEQFDSVQPEELKTGDLVYFSGRSRSKRVGHVGIVVSKNDNGTFDFIHAAVRKGVTISNSDEAYYSRRFVKANRVVGFDPFSVVRSAATDNISSNLNEEPIAPIVNNSNVQRIRKSIPAEYHRVKRGETLSSIAEKYGMTIAELKEKRQKSLLSNEGISKEVYEVSLNELNIQEAEVQLIKAQIDKTELSAPFNGIIGLKKISDGAYVVAGTPITVLQNNSIVKIDFSVPEKYSNQIKINDNIKFGIDGDEKQYSAKIYATEPNVDANTRTLKIRARAENNNGRLYPGVYAKVTVDLKDIKDAILVPTQALVQDFKGNKVFTVSKGKAVACQVETGTRKADVVHILNGLKEGDTVVVSGVISLKSGAKVNIKNQGM